MRKKTKTYNSRDSLVVTHPTTNRPACGFNAVSNQVGASWVSLEWAPLFGRATHLFSGLMEADVEIRKSYTEQDIVCRGEWILILL